MRILLAICALVLGSTVASASTSMCIGCTFSTDRDTAQEVERSIPATQERDNRPRRRDAVESDTAYCRSGAPYCLVANSSTRTLSLFAYGEGVIAWDIIMRPVNRVRRGHISAIDHDPWWCPPDSVREEFPDLPDGCLAPEHEQNAMGDLKISMNGDFAGTAIRIHDTRGFGAEWPNEDSAGCVRVLDLADELLPHIENGNARVEVVFH